MPDGKSGMIMKWFQTCDDNRQTLSSAPADHGAMTVSVFDRPFGCPIATARVAGMAIDIGIGLVQAPKRRNPAGHWNTDKRHPPESARKGKPIRKSGLVHYSGAAHNPSFAQDASHLLYKMLPGEVLLQM
jgi:hypothetical protein